MGEGGKLNAAGDSCLDTFLTQLNPEFSTKDKSQLTKTHNLSSRSDAWSLGAIDPTSGTATMLEITRVLGDMYRKGTRSLLSS